MTSDRAQSTIESNPTERRSTENLSSTPERRWRRASLVVAPLVRFILFIAFLLNVLF
jgi:hypothetical protein